MKMMRLVEMNKYMAGREHQGTPHNVGIKTQTKIEEAGHEVKVNPPKVLEKTRRKFGKKRAEAQRKAIILSKAKEAGAKISKK